MIGDLWHHAAQIAHDIVWELAASDIDPNDTPLLPHWRVFAGVLDEFEALSELAEEAGETVEVPVEAMFYFSLSAAQSAVDEFALEHGRSWMDPAPAAAQAPAAKVKRAVSWQELVRQAEPKGQQPGLAKAEGSRRKRR